MASGAGTLAAKIGRGLLAGAVGTAAMTVSSTLEQKLRGREPSTAPADAAMKVLGIESFCDDAAKNRFSNIVHWAYGSAWGVPRGLLDAAGLSPAAATAAHGAALWGSEQVMLPLLGVAPPLWTWGVTEVAIDAIHHVVYTLATSVAYEALG
ncbi:MAG: hypothetical protein QOH72_5617 [Solirubrobacteraceae bacterium]|jgi:hypothetical protein|nr:hypothetical protein [Solirubrobacteraceae bacterium]